MQIIKKRISTVKPDGTYVTYYIFPEYEIHYNELPPKTEQQWHYHKLIEETIYIIEGELEIHWVDNAKKEIEKVSPGDIVRVEKTQHTLLNNSDKVSKFIVFRLILSGNDKRKIIKNDKHFM